METSNQQRVLNQDEWSVVWQFVNFHDFSHNLSLSLINKAWHAKSSSDEFWKLKYYLNDDDNHVMNDEDDEEDDDNSQHLTPPKESNFKRKLIRERRKIFFTMSDQQFEIVSILIQIGTVMAVFAFSLMAFLFVLNSVSELLANSAIGRSGFEELGYRNRFYFVSGSNSCLIKVIEPFPNKCDVSSRFKDVFGWRKEWNNVYYFIGYSVTLSVLSFLMAVGISYLRKIIDMNLLIENGKITERSIRKKIKYRSNDLCIMLALFLMCRHNLNRQHMIR